MKVVRAEELGMCFGVRDALALARALPEPDEVTIHGELVHNPLVVAELDARGFRRSPEAVRAGLPATPAVLVTAHGVSDRERARLAEAGKRVVDATCPLVRFAHEGALALAREGRFVVVVGRRGHVEVEGLTGDLERFDVVEDEREARAYGEPRLGVVAQTTTPPLRFARVVAALRAANPASDLRAVDSVCGPTRNRQLAVVALLDRVEALVVVGGRASNNTRELVALALARGVPAVQVEDERGLDPGLFPGVSVVGLTAGTSTLDETVERVHRALAALETPAPVAP